MNDIRDDGPPDEPDQFVTYQDVLSQFEPAMVDQILSHGRQHDGDDGPYWPLSEFRELVAMIPDRTGGLRP